MKSPSQLNRVLDVADPQSTTVDWWDFRAKPRPLEVREILESAFYRDTGSLPVCLTPRKGGGMGYENSSDIHLAGMKVGLCAYGGESQRSWSFVRLFASGCQWLADIDFAQDAFRTLPMYEARRVDIALTTTDGSVRYPDVVAAYRSGGFSLGRRPPTMTQILAEDPRDGSTIYVGRRDSDKFCRGYEKGAEMRSALPASARETCTHIDGFRVEDIFRLELELKAKTCPLPLDLIDRRDQYFSGAYPYLQKVLAIEPQLMTIRRERDPQHSLKAALAQLRHQYGSTLFTALMAHGGDLTELWPKICGDKHNERLVEAGALLVEHYE